MTKHHVDVEYSREIRDVGAIRVSTIYPCSTPEEGVQDYLSERDSGRTQRRGNL